MRGGRQTGSQMILRHKWLPHHRLVVPERRELAKETVRAIIREAGLTVREFVTFL